jgi:plasmid replication initiation protein
MKQKRKHKAISFFIEKKLRSIRHEGANKNKILGISKLRAKTYEASGL